MNVPEKKSKHLKMVSGKTSKIKGLLRKLQKLLPRAVQVTIYEAFIRPHLNYGDILYDQAHNVFSPKGRIRSV